MSPQQRIDNYHAVLGYPESMWVDAEPLHLAGNGRIIGCWEMGANYRVKSGYYGGYPSGYLARVAPLFPDKEMPFHLCAGKVALDMAPLPGITVDTNATLPGINYVDNAETLEHTPIHAADLVCADVPYSKEDCEHYGTPMLNRNKVMATLGQRLTRGAHVCWLDQVLPMYRNDEFRRLGLVSMVKSTNHRFRVVTIFEKL